MFFTLQFSKMFWGLFIGDGMQLCTCIQIFLYATRWRQYRVSNFKPRIFRFSAHILLYFLKNVYSQGSVLSCDNGQCDAHPAGIALTRSSHCFCFQFKHYFNRERIENQISNSKTGVLIYNSFNNKMKRFRNKETGELETKATTTSSHCNIGRTCLPLPITTRENTSLAIHIDQKITIIRAQTIGKFAV